MSFFIKKGGVKRKTHSAKLTNGVDKKKPKVNPVNDNEEIDSDGLDSDGSEDANLENSFLDQDNETVEKKKLRLAKEYINEVKEKLKKFDDSDDEDDDDRVGDALRKEAALKMGVISREVASNITDLSLKHQLRGHKGVITCCCCCSDNKYIFTGGKDCSIIKWSVDAGIKLWLIKSGRKPGNLSPGHTGDVLAIAISSDSKYLVSGGTDKTVFVWNPEDKSLYHKLSGHRGSIVSLSFRSNSYQLFSSSVDRFVKVWQVDDATNTENLCGHEGTVSNVDCLSKDRPLSCGTNDKSIRMWKIAENSQLIFNSTTADCIDVVCYVTEELFISGDTSGAVTLWSTRKKKPAFHVADAHAPEWVTCVSAIGYSDIAASGSCNGVIKIWKVQPNKLTLVSRIEQPGFVNSIVFSNSADWLFLCISQEHRLGRWRRIAECKNTTHIFEIKNNIN